MPKVFVTGASGFIGRHVVPELLDHGYEVLALARSDASAEALSRAGAIPHHGSLDDLESLKAGARQSDGVIHLAFIHDFSSAEAFSKATAADRAAIQAMAEGLEGSEKPLIICSGTLSYPKGVLADEDTEPERRAGIDRDLSVEMIKKLSHEKNIRGMVVRLSPTVHGKGDHGFINILGQMAQKNGFVSYLGDGSSHWPAVHVKDAAVLFRLAFEKGKAASNYNGVAEQGISQKEIQGAIGKKLGLPVESKTADDLTPLLGFFATLVGHDNLASSDKTQKELGWKPKEVALLQDIAENYF